MKILLTLLTLVSIQAYAGGPSKEMMDSTLYVEDVINNKYKSVKKTVRQFAGMCDSTRWREINKSFNQWQLKCTANSRSIVFLMNKSKKGNRVLFNSVQIGHKSAINAPHLVATIISALISGYEENKKAEKRMGDF